MGNKNWTLYLHKRFPAAASYIEKAAFFSYILAAAP